MIVSRKCYLLILILAITASLSLFFDCNSSRTIIQKKDSGNLNSYNPYFPIAGDMEWKYINQAPRDETLLFNVKISNLKNSGESVTAEFDPFPFFNKQKVKSTVKINKSGEVYVIDSTENEKLLLPDESKLQKGYNWQYGSWLAVVGDTNVSVKTEKETIENCLYVNYGLGGFTFVVELWLAKGKGIVKWGANRTNPPSLNTAYFLRY
jgi:hypothetical protein